MTQHPIKRSFHGKALASAAVVFVVALVVYGRTLAPTVTLVDSGELIVAARFLGVAHPPGFPLYLLLAHIASLIPIGNVAMRVNFASAFFAALACAMLSLVVTEILVTSSYLAESKRQFKRAARKHRKPAQSVAHVADDKASWLMASVSAVGAGLLFAFSRTLWSYATIAEVYSLNTLLILTVFFLMTRWRRRIVEEQGWTSGTAKSGRPTGTVTQYDFWLYSAAVVFGLALGVHHVTVALILPALAVLVYQSQGISFFASKRFFYAAVLSFAALLAVYSYLPLAAAHKPVLNWGDPRSFRAIWAHVTGKQYQLFLSFSPAIIGEELLRFGRFLLREFGRPWLPIALVVAVAGFVAARKRDRTIFLWLLFVVLGNLAYNLNYEIAEDKDAYYLPVFVAIAIAAGIGFSSLLHLPFAKRTSHAGRLFVPVIVALVPVLALAGNWPFNNRRHYFIAHDYVENIQNTIEPNSLLLTLDWQVASPMLYTREIEHRRPDIKVVDVLLLRRSWYFDYLRRAYPEMIERSRNEIDNYLVDLKHWESDPAVYRKSDALTREITNSFQRMIQSLVRKEFEIAPVYVTNELFVMRESQEIDLNQWLNRNFQAVPKGLVFQLFRDREFHDPGELHLERRGLTDGTIRFEDDDVVKMKVIPTYRAMLENRSRYLAHFNQPARAAAAFGQARQFDTNSRKNQRP